MSEKGKSTKGGIRLDTVGKKVSKEKQMEYFKQKYSELVKPTYKQVKLETK